MLLSEHHLFFPQRFANYGPTIPQSASPSGHALWTCIHSGGQGELSMTDGAYGLIDKGDFEESAHHLQTS